MRYMLVAFRNCFTNTPETAIEFRTLGVRVFYSVYIASSVAKLVEALRYKPEGRGFDSRWSH